MYDGSHFILYLINNRADKLHGPCSCDHKMTHIHHPHPIEKLPRSRAQRLLKALTSYYAIALLIAIGCAYVFGWLADEVTEGEFGSLNSSILLSIHTHRSAALDQLAFAITWLG